MKVIIRSLLILLTVLVSAAGAKDKDKGLRVTANLKGAQEVPVVLTVATGTFRGVVSPDNQSINWELSYSGLQGTVTQAHIHIAQKSVNGGITIWLCQTATNTPPAGPTAQQCTPGSGLFTGTITSANVIAIGTQQVGTGDLANVIAAMRGGNAYANVHTSLSPGGEIRGQIKALGENDDDDDDED